MKEKEKILLAIAPYWSPLIPPMGIAYLKSYLQPFGYPVKTVDSNVEESFKTFYNRYFDLLEALVPGDKLGNLHNIGHDVLQNHMMAHLHATDEGEYRELVCDLFYQYYFFLLADEEIDRLNQVWTDFYRQFGDYIDRLLAEEQPDVLGLTVYCGNLPASLFAFKRAKSRFPHIKTVMGGGIFSQQLGPGSPNFDLFLEKTRDAIDKILIGEGQKLLLAYLQGELADDQRVYTLADIREQPLDASQVRLPDLADFDLTKYPYIGATGSRSCPNRCAFCNSRVFWGEYTKRPAACVAEEILTLHQKHGFSLFYMSDSQLNPVIAELSKELIDRRSPIYFDAYLRAFAADCPPVSEVNNTLLWRQAGFYRARIGCESGSQRILDTVGKELTVDHIRAAVRSLAYAGIKTTTYWVVGLPGETEEDFLQTLALVEELKNDIYQAECAAFIYYYSGQNQSDEWADRRHLLFSPTAKDLLLTQTWILDCQPPRPVIYERVNRFVAHIDRLGIPNPFFMHEIHQADERWKRLQKNAVPSLLEIDTKTAYDRVRNRVKTVQTAWTRNRYDEGEFVF